MLRAASISVLALLALVGFSRWAASAELASMPPIDRFNYVVGTQTIGASYQFTSQPRLVETAQAILDMGSNVLKFRLAGMRKKGDGDTGLHTLTELARDDAANRAVLQMPFAYYVIWTYTSEGGNWRGGYAQADQAKEYKEFYEFACYLLRTFNRSDKTFFLGHWEGDWMLRGLGNRTDEDKVTPAAIQGMIDWLNVRQRALDDAKRDTPHQNVAMFHYTEANLVTLARQGRKTVANDVLPKTNVDYVSYSSYDTQHSPAQLKASLDYLESKLPNKPGIAGKRVFIGEFGFPAEKYPPAKQDEMSRQVMRAGLEWGCPLVLYWEMYNNEVDKSGKQRGFWLIDDHGMKQPIYETHQRFYQQARQYLKDFQKSHVRLPSDDEFRREAVKWLDGNTNPSGK